MIRRNSSSLETDSPRFRIFSTSVSSLSNRFENPCGIGNDGCFIHYIPKQ